MTDPLAPFDPGSDPLAPPPADLPQRQSITPATEPKSPDIGATDRDAAKRPDDDTTDSADAPSAADAPPNPVGFARPGTLRPGGPPPRPGTSVHEANVVDLPPLPRKRSLFYRIVSFSWELTLGASLALLILVAAGVFYVIDWVESIGPSYSAAEFYDEQRFEILVKDGDRVVYDTYLDKVGAWDHDDCAAIATETSVQDDIAAAGCEYGIEAVYDRADLEYTIYQRVLEFPDATSAEAALAALGPQDELAKKLRFSEPYPDEARYGAVADTEDRFLIVTVGALENDENRDEAEEGIDTFHTSNLNFLVMDNL